MRILLILSFAIFALFASCEKGPTSGDAEIIAFNPEKCGCCWGWTIKVGDETIKTDDVMIGELVGYRINKPIKVTVELGEQDETCSDYYEVKNISLK